MKTISVLNMKGGVGKTTTSINLAIGLGNLGNKVLVIDFDPQANSSDIFTTEGNEYKYIDEVLEDTLPVVYESTHKNVSFIPSRLELALTERKIMLEQNKAQHSRLFKAIKGIRKDFDYIVIDCPPILNLLTVNALNASNEIIIPIKIDKAAEKGFAITLSNITEIADSYDLELDYKVLFTMVNNTKIDKARMDQIIGNCKDNTINTRIRYQSKPVTEAGYKKVPVVEGNSNVGQDYKELCDELIATWTSCPGKKE